MPRVRDGTSAWARTGTRGKRRPTLQGRRNRGPTPSPRNVETSSDGGRAPMSPSGGRATRARNCDTSSLSDKGCVIRRWATNTTGAGTARPRRARCRPSALPQGRTLALRPSGDSRRREAGRLMDPLLVLAKSADRTTLRRAHRNGRAPRQRPRPDHEGVSLHGNAKE
jgi:hypothetical protein